MTLKLKTLVSLLLVAALAAGASVLVAADAASTSPNAEKPDLAAWHKQLETWKKEPDRKSEAGGRLAHSRGSSTG